MVSTRKACYLRSNDFGNVYARNIISGTAKCNATVDKKHTNILVDDSDSSPSFDLENCQKPEEVGDGICDDELNNEQCLFDGGDCCLAKIDCSYCAECHCVKTSMVLCWPSLNMVLPRERQQHWNCKGEINKIPHGFMSYCMLCGNQPG